jgi:hypothetical protein
LALRVALALVVVGAAVQLVQAHARSLRLHRLAPPASRHRRYAPAFSGEHLDRALAPQKRHSAMCASLTLGSSRPGRHSWCSVMEGDEGSVRVQARTPRRRWRWPATAQTPCRSVEVTWGVRRAVGVAVGVGELLKHVRDGWRLCARCACGARWAARSGSPGPGAASGERSPETSLAGKIVSLRLHQVVVHDHIGDAQDRGAF